MLLLNPAKEGKKEQVKLHLHGIHNETKCNWKAEGSGPTLLISKMLFKEWLKFNALSHLNPKLLVAKSIQQGSLGRSCSY